MPASDPAHRAAAARLAGTRRWRPEQDTIDLERDLHAARLAAAIRRELHIAPPLTRPQRAELAALLLGDDAGAGQ